MHLAQATADFASATTDVTNSVLVSINRGSRVVRAGSAAGGALGVLSDGLDTGLFLYDEFNAEARARSDRRYGDDFVDREVGYNCVIAGGKVVSTVGSALMCSVVLAPAGILVKAVGLGISNFTEFAREMDRLGEEEQELCRMIWRRMNADCADFRSYYNRMVRTHGRSFPWTHVQTQFDNLERGVGDHWVSISSNHIRAVRMAFNRRDHRG